MKRKSIIVMLALVLTIAFFTACGEKHKYSDEWKFDETGHWHECIKKKHTDITEKLPHELTWTEKTPAGVHIDKVEKGVCECGYETERTIANTGTHTYSEEWKKDESGHWHESSCDAKVPTHAVMKKDFAVHVFDEGVETKPADYGVVGERTFTCTVCGFEKKESINALGAKENEINLVDGKTLDKTYDGKVIDVSDKFAFNGNGEVTITFKNKDADDNTYIATAPMNAGEYTVKVSVVATAEWKGTSKTFDFTIAKKELTVEVATKEYDGTTTIPANLVGVIDGETVTATITMTSKNVGATIQEVTLEGANKENYVLDKAKVVASITPIQIYVDDWEQEYNNSNIITGTPWELLEGDEVTFTITMDSANVGAAVQSVELTGKDAVNYSLAKEDVNATIIKAEIVNFEINNLEAFTNTFFVGATNIPEPTTDYVEIGTGYGEMSISWEMEVENGMWGPIYRGIERIRERAGNYRVRIKYDEGTNYNFKATSYVYFIVNLKERSITVRNFEGKTYDNKPVSNFTFDLLVNKIGASTIEGVENLTTMSDGEQYVEFRRKGEEVYTKVTDIYIPKNASEYEYRIGIKGTEEWAETVSDIKTFTIKPYEFVLELGYGQNQNNESLDKGKTFILRTYKDLIEYQRIELWLDNEKAGLQTVEKNNSVYYFVPNQKKQVTIDCFFLKIGNITGANMENYKIVSKYSYISTVEITVVEYNPLTLGKSGLIANVRYTAAETWLTTTVSKGYFKVGLTVEVYNRSGTKVGEATITNIEVEDTNASGFTKSPSGFAIPVDGKVRITLDKVFKDSSTGGYISLMEGYIKTK